jgi:hypothetical protein
VLDAYGVAEQAHLWPAQKLLDYGNAILHSLRPGMVHVGGTDNGRWIPELLNETSGGEQHIMVTQNAFADGRYLDFMNTLYSDRMTTLTTEDSQAAFQNYVTDAQKRLEHDQQFPDEPKQVRPGENIQMVDGKVQVSGAASVMAINEQLLQSLMQKNPDLSFAVQESFPFKGTYGPQSEPGCLVARPTPRLWMKTVVRWYSFHEPTVARVLRKRQAHGAAENHQQRRELPLHCRPLPGPCSAPRKDGKSRRPTHCVWPMVPTPPG